MGLSPRAALEVGNDREISPLNQQHACQEARTSAASVGYCFHSAGIPAIFWLTYSGDPMKHFLPASPSLRSVATFSRQLYWNPGKMYTHVAEFQPFQNWCHEQLPHAANARLNRC